MSLLLNHTIASATVRHFLTARRSFCQRLCVLCGSNLRKGVYASGLRETCIERDAILKKTAGRVSCDRDDSWIDGARFSQLKKTAVKLPPRCGIEIAEMPKLNSSRSFEIFCLRLHCLSDPWHVQRILHVRLPDFSSETDSNSGW